MIVLLALVFLPTESQSADLSSAKNAINAVLGDQSFVERFGHLPDEGTPDYIRIRTHLEYVEDMLRNAPTGHLSPSQKENRIKYLGYLREYHHKGEFPFNDGHADPRRPTFIAENGNICAVGYLVERSAGRHIAEKVNGSYKYAFIREIDDPVFLAWAEESGFSMMELASIQPQYGSVVIEEHRRNKNSLNARFAINSGILLGLNGLYWGDVFRHPDVGIGHTAHHLTGLLVGSGTLLYGLANVINSTETYMVASDGSIGWQVPMIRMTETNHLQSGIAIGHMVVGGATVLRSLYSFVYRKDGASQDASGLTVNYMYTHPDLGSVPVPAVSYRWNF